MIPLTAQQIAAAVQADVIHGDADNIAETVTIDSRAVAPGSCFFAIVGEHHDGHDFCAAALQQGARVIVAERVPQDVSTEDGAIVLVGDTTAALQRLGGWLRRRLDPLVVGVTGSLGKTTTKELAAELLALNFSVHATPGNLNNHWGLPLSLLGLEPRHQVMVAELAMSAAGEIRDLARIAAPSIGLITNIAPVHMQNFADLQAVAAAKGELAESLPGSGTFIVNADDPLVAAMPAALAPQVSRVVSFGLDAHADVRAVDPQRTASGWSFELRIGDATRAMNLNIPGRAGIYSFLGAAAIASAVDIEIDAIAAHAAELRPPANRGAVSKVHGVTVLDETYNASPVAMNAAIDTLAALAADRHIAVLGDMLEMGAWTAQVHRDAGAHAHAAGIELLVVVGAFSGFVAEGAAASGMDLDSIHEFEEADAAADWLVPRLLDGDALLVKGSRAVHLEHVVHAVAAAAELRREMDR